MRNLLFFVLICCLTACNNVTAQLDNIELLLWSEPDSALAAVQDSNLEHECSSEKNKARFALLTSIALDKNYIDITSDSIIHIALDYYKDSKDLKRKMLAWYYNGIVHKNSGNYQEAIIDFEQAGKYATEAEDIFYQGLTDWRKGDLFSTTNNNEQSIEYYKSAVNCFSIIDAPIYYEYAKFSLAQCLANARMFHQADSVIFSFTTPISDKYLEGKLKLLRAQIMLEQNLSATEILSLYEDVPLDTYEMLDYSLHGLAFERNGQPDSSDKWLSMAYRQAIDWADSASIDVQNALIAKTRKQYMRAYNLLDNAIQAQDSLTRQILQQSISSRLRDYYKNDAEEKEQSYQRLLQKFALIGLVIVLAITVMVLLFILSSRKKNQRIKEHMAALLLSQNSLQEAQRTNILLSGSLFRDKFIQLNQISAEYFESDSDANKELVFKTFKNRLHDLQSNNTLYEFLEQDLNRYCDNIMLKLRAQVPDINGKNIHIIALFFAGVSYRGVQLITGAQSVDALKTKRTRFRKSILNSNAVDTNLFLSMLEIKKAAMRINTNDDC